MKKLKGFKTFTYPLLENINVKKYERLIDKSTKNIDVELHNVSTYKTVVSVLIPVVERFTSLNKNTSTLLTVFSITALTHESKSKLKDMYDYLKENEITDDYINMVINLLKNLYYLYNNLLKKSYVEVKNFIDMLDRTDVVIPFLYSILELLDSNLINKEVFFEEWETFKSSYNEDSYKLLLYRILHRINIMIGGRNKFQNKENIKPLKVNDEFKSPMYKNVDTHLE